MSHVPDVLWINTSPSLQCFDKNLVNSLSQNVRLGYWEYQQSLDEPSLLNVAVTLVHDYLKSHNKPIHLIGHSTGGLVALFYARQFPERVKSLTLLSVGVHPTIDWKSHYYVQRQLLPCRRRDLLEHLVDILFGELNPKHRNKLLEILDRDLTESFSLHSLFQRYSLPPSGVSVPLMVCGSQDDIIVDSNELHGWRELLKEEDHICQLPYGGHFFHHSYPRIMTEEILAFWAKVDPSLRELKPKYSTVN